MIKRRYPENTSIVSCSVCISLQGTGGATAGTINKSIPINENEFPQNTDAVIMPVYIRLTEPFGMHLRMGLVQNKPRTPSLNYTFVSSKSRPFYVMYVIS